MEEIRKKLEIRRSKLLQIKKEKEKSLKGAPEGKLRISRNKKSFRYYMKTENKPPADSYISHKETELIHKLAQKDYDEKILKSVNVELGAINRYLASFKHRRPEEIYEGMHKERQKLVNAIRETDEQFVSKWEAVSYQRKGIDDTIPKLYSAKGERVRSKSEIIIADAMYNETVPYRYECPLLLKGWGTIYPDFTALNVKKRKVIYWEHFGMMDDSEYAEKAIQKISLYEENGIYIGENLIVTWETKMCPINPKKVRQLIQKYLI